MPENPDLAGGWCPAAAGRWASTTGKGALERQQNQGAKRMTPQPLCRQPPEASIDVSRHALALAQVEQGLERLALSRRVKGGGDRFGGSHALAAEQAVERRRVSSSRLTQVAEPGKTRYAAWRCHGCRTARQWMGMTEADLVADRPRREAHRESQNQARKVPQRLATTRGNRQSSVGSRTGYRCAPSTQRPARRRRHPQTVAQRLWVGRTRLQRRAQGGRCRASSVSSPAPRSAPVGEHDERWAGAAPARRAARTGQTTGER